MNWRCPGADNYVYCLALQPDGKIVVGGYFTTLDGQTRNYLGRLNADGTVDATFNPGANGALYSIAVQADGKILVGGAFTALASQTRNYLGRLNADGTLDTAFNPGASYPVYSLAVQADGKILAGGSFWTLGGQSRNYLGRLNANGTVDTAFNPGANDWVYSLAVQADGRILVGGRFLRLGGEPRSFIGRLNADGTVDATFNPGAGGYVISLAVQADGKVLAGGSFSTLAGRTRSKIGRLNSTGSPTEDLAFDGSTITWLRGGTGPEVWRTTFEASTNGVDWTSLGAGTRISGGWRLTSVALPANAALRARGFVAGGYDNASSWFIESVTSTGVPAFVTQPASRTNNAGTTATFNLTACGTVPLHYRWRKGDLALADGGNITGAATSTLTLSNVLKSDEGGYSVVVSNTDGSVTSLVASLTVIDPAINGQPVSQNREPGQGVSFSVTAAGTAPLSYQWRREVANLSDGGSISGVTTPTLTLTNLQAADAAGYSVVVSNQYGTVTSAVALLTVNLATLDLAFNPGANDTVCALAVQPDGKVWVGGYFTTLAGQPRKWIARLNADGTLDSQFSLTGSSSSHKPGGTPSIVGDDGSLPGTGGGGGGGGSNPYFVSSLAVQTDGKILAGGWFLPPGGQAPVGTARLNANGTLDSGFSSVAAGGTYPYVNCLVVQPDGRILAGGSFTTLTNQTRNGLGRLNANGTLDSTFNPGAGGAVYALAVQADGKILVGGSFTNLAGQTCSGLGRLNASGTLDTSFNPGVGGSYPYVYSVAVQADGKILVGGAFTILGGQVRSGIGRLKADGTLDNTFNPGANPPWVCSLAVQADGKILVVGTFATLGGQTRSGLGRLNSDGTPDLLFNLGAGANAPFVFALALQADGKILVGGGFSTLGPNGAARSCLGRLNNPDSATQNLSSDGSAVTWLRSGASPEAQRTTFDYSTNGVDWASLGAGTRITGGWQLSSVSVPASATIRARAFVSGGLCNGSSGFVESTAQVVPQTPPTILTDDGSFGFRTNQFGFNLAGVAGQTVVIEASTNLVNWTALATNLLGAGPLYFSDPGSTNIPARFYRAFQLP